jgi:hypothetical protein
LRDDSTSTRAPDASANETHSEAFEPVDRIDTARAIPPATLADLFALQAARTPDAIALECGDRPPLSYAQLDRWANQLAHHLRTFGTGPERLVGLCVERSPAMIAALLGVVKAGGAYLPLDPGYPEARLVAMADDAGIDLLVSNRAQMARLPGLGKRQVICLDAAADQIAAQPETAPQALAVPDNLAYVIWLDRPAEGRRGHPSRHPEHGIGACREPRHRAAEPGAAILLHELRRHGVGDRRDLRRRRRARADAGGRRAARRHRARQARDACDAVAITARGARGGPAAAGDRRGG